MNNEPPLILISNQLITVYKATVSCSREGLKERGSIIRKKKGGKAWGIREGVEEAQARGLFYYDVIVIFGLAHTMDTLIQNQTRLPRYTSWHFV